jgi:ankyrin repeat protein
VSDLPARPSLEYLRKLAKHRRRDRRIALSAAQHEIAHEYGFESWPRLVRHVQAFGLHGIERALVLADVVAVDAWLRDTPAAIFEPVAGLPPLLFLLRRATGAPADVRQVAARLVQHGADPDSHTDMDGWGQSALFDAVERRDAALVRLLLDHGAAPDEDAFYHACEQSDPTFLDLLYQPGYAPLVNHKLDFEDAAGLRWFLDRGVDVNAHACLHWAIGRGRGLTILTMLIEAGADVNLPRTSDRRRPLAIAAGCGHLAAYDLLTAAGATADLDPVEQAVLAIARGQSVHLPAAPAPVLGVADGRDYSWILGQFALLGRTDVVAALLDDGMPVDTRGWSNFTPLEQAAMHGRTQTVQLLLDRGADVHDRAFDTDGPSPLDCAIWGYTNNQADDGDYSGTVQALLAAGATTAHRPPTGHPGIDAMLTTARTSSP